MTIAAGIDIGTATIKAALFKVENGEETWLSRYVMRIRQRDPMELAQVAYDAVLDDAKLKPEDVNYVATTGEAESVPFHTGHFYSMTTHARGAIYLDPESRAALDMGALHGRAISIDRARQSSQLQDDQPMRVGLRPIPGEYRPLSGHRAGRDRRLVGAGRQSRGRVQHLRRAGGNRRHQHGVARHYARRTSSRESICRWRRGYPNC